jgi:hypothetical protein
MNPNIIRAVAGIALAVGSQIVLGRINTNK